MVEIISRPKIKKWKIKCDCGAELKYTEGDEYNNISQKEIKYYIYCPLCKLRCITRRYSTTIEENFMTGEREYPLIIDYRSEEFYE